MNNDPNRGRIDQPMNDDLATCWFDAEGTDELLSYGDPAWFLTDQRNEFLSGLTVIVVNRTGLDLVVVEQRALAGRFEWGTESTLVAPPSELGPGSSSAGIWRLGVTNRPTFVVKFDGTPATNSQPVYVAADISHRMFDQKCSTVVWNEERGSASTVYDDMVGGDSYGNVADDGNWHHSVSQAGCVDAKATATDDWLVVVATITDSRQGHTS